MPVKFRVSVDGQAVHTVASGVLDGEELLACVEAMLHHPALRPGFSELTDLRRVERVEVSDEALAKLHALDRKHLSLLRQGRLAIVATDAAVFRFAQGYEQAARPMDLRVVVFSSMSTARLWLGPAPERWLSSEGVPLKPVEEWSERSWTSED